jgi:F0F1-type ATP synthase assembly protein I
MDYQKLLNGGYTIIKTGAFMFLCFHQKSMKFKNHIVIYADGELLKILVVVENYFVYRKDATL